MAFINQIFIITVAPNQAVSLALGLFFGWKGSSARKKVVITWVFQSSHRFLRFPFSRLRFSAWPQPRTVRVRPSTSIDSIMIVSQGTYLHWSSPLWYSKSSIAYGCLLFKLVEFDGDFLQLARKRVNFAEKVRLGLWDLDILAVGERLTGVESTTKTHWISIKLYNTTHSRKFWRD